MRDHHIDIFWSAEDEAYIANLPDFEFCSAHGASPEEALKELMIAKSLWIEVSLERGVPIPEPRYVPLIYRVAG